MNVYDYILLVILAYFIYIGAKSGFVAMIGGFIGIIIGAWAAGHYFDVVAQWIIEIVNVNILAAIVISFVGIYILVNVAVGLLVKIISKVFRIIPLATTTNRLIGAALGLLEGALIMGLIIWIINLLPFQTAFAKGLEESKVANAFQASTSIVQPLLPKSLRDFDFSLLQDLNNFPADKAEYLRQFMPALLEKSQEYHEELQQEYDERMREPTDEELNATTTPAN